MSPYRAGHTGKEENHVCWLDYFFVYIYIYVFKLNTTDTCVWEVAMAGVKLKKTRYSWLLCAKYV